MTLSVKFISNSPHHIYGKGTTINPSFLYVKTYFDLYSDEKVEWLPWWSTLLYDEQTQIDKILEEKPDVLAFAMFIWNQKIHHSIAKKIKELLPNTIILMGGPQLNAHKNENFFKEHPYVDWVCYGDGERAFYELLTYFIKKGNKDKFVNLVENNNGETLVYPFEIFSDDLYWKTSPYLTNKEIIQSTNELLEDHGFDKKDIRWAVEFARGCPYKCSFCDWSSALHHKVKRWTRDWREDLHYFLEQNVPIVETDANFGQYKEDIEIFDYALDLHLKNPGTNFKLGIVNTSKLKKEATYHIMLNQAKFYEGFPIILSMQDINEDILDNIERPSISYSEQIELVQKFKENLPKDKHKLIAWVHIILGLPGQTFDRVADMVLKLMKDGINGAMLELQFWAYLENMPAANKDYKDKFNLDWLDVHSFTSETYLNEFKDLEDVYEKINNNQYNQSLVYSYKSIYNSGLMSYEEIIASKFLSLNIRRYQRENNTRLDLFDKEKLEIEFNKIKENTLIEAKYFIESHSKLIEKYNFAVLAIDRAGQLKTINPN